MKKSICLLVVVGLVLGFNPGVRAEMPAVLPAKVSTTSDFRQLLLATKWMWKNVSAGVPDRECVFMPDGTFRHPNFVAKFTIKDINTVELSRKGGERAVLVFDSAYMNFEALDFDQKRRITGTRAAAK